MLKLFIRQGTSYSNDYNINAIWRNRKDFEQSSKQDVNKFCSNTHKCGSCPAYNKICNSCHKKGHFSKCCINFKRQDIKQINIDESKFYGSDDEDLFIGTITSNENLKFEENDNEWSIDLDVNWTSIQGHK